MKTGVGWAFSVQCSIGAPYRARGSMERVLTILPVQRQEIREVGFSEVGDRDRLIERKHAAAPRSARSTSPRSSSMLILDPHAGPLKYSLTEER